MLKLLVYLGGNHKTFIHLFYYQKQITFYLGDIHAGITAQWPNSS